MEDVFSSKLIKSIEKIDSFIRWEIDRNHLSAFLGNDSLPRIIFSLSQRNLTKKEFNSLFADEKFEG